jgi:hypothetical protein
MSIKFFYLIYPIEEKREALSVRGISICFGAVQARYRRYIFPKQFFITAQIGCCLKGPIQYDGPVIADVIQLEIWGRKREIIAMLKVWLTFWVISFGRFAA